MKNQWINLIAVAVLSTQAHAAAVPDAAHQEILRAARAAALSKPGKDAAQVPAAGPAAKEEKETDPCKEHTNLERMRYTFTLTRQGQDPIVINFRYTSCSVNDRTPDGDPVTPEAGRTFTGDVGGWAFIISHELGADEAGLGFIQNLQGGGFLISASFDNKPVNQLLTGTLNLGEVRVWDWRVPRGQEIRGTGTLAAGR